MELEFLCLLAPGLPSNKQVNLTWHSITLGHKMSLPGGYIWPKVNLTKVVTHLATRCLCMGVHLTTGHLDQSCNTLGHKMSLSGGQVDILFNRQSASQLQLASQASMWKHVRLQVGQIVGGRRTGGLTTLGPSTPTCSPWGVTYLTKARQVTQMSSAALYIPLALLSGTVWSFVSMWPSQSDSKPDQMSTWPKASSWGVHLTKCHQTQSSSILGHKMCLLGGTSDQRSAWPKVWPNVNLTQSLILGVHLTKCQPDPK